MKNISKTVYVNNTGADLTQFHNEIVAAIDTGSNLPEEISDLLNLELVQVDDGIRGIISWV